MASAEETLEFLGQFVLEVGLAPTRIRAAAVARILAYLLRGRGHERAPDILYGHDLDRVEIVCDSPLPLQVDGEDLGDVETAVFEAERGAIAVLV